MLKISIVTPTKNNASTIERTILSIKNQQDENLQYIVIDGGSDDGTSEIIHRHSGLVSEYVTEPDDGQYDAIKKGFSRADGDIFAWINADDFYLPWAFSIVRDIFSMYPDVLWVSGLPAVYNEVGQCVNISRLSSYPDSWISKGLFNGRFANYLQQESMFWRRSLWENSGGLDCRVRYAADYELWTRFALLSDLVVLTVPIGGFTRRHGAVQRSIIDKQKYAEDVESISRKLSESRFQRFVSGNRYTAEFYRQINPRKSRFAVYDMQARKWNLVPLRLAVSQFSIYNFCCEWMHLR